MKAARISQTVSLCLVLLGCGSQTQQSTPAQQRAETPSPTPAAPLEHTHDERKPLDETSSGQHQHDDMHSMLRLDQGKPWATDAPLVEGMERIRDAVEEAAALPALDADTAAELAQVVRGQDDYLIANCRLEPDADVTLHVFIGQLLNAASALQKNPASADGLPRMQETLREYPNYFAHPEWLTESAGKG
jgi:hypothetical protein